MAEQVDFVFVQMKELSSTWCFFGNLTREFLMEALFVYLHSHTGPLAALSEWHLPSDITVKEQSPGVVHYHGHCVYIEL